ncbi:MAG: 4Fe-4S dicluster domain-containing protein [Spirochaetales bacterium]|nr:4Fe-4S dicluster domain-containing protein [Spirochaetales bacterium]
MFFIAEEKLHILLTRLTDDYQVCVPRKKNGKLHQTRFPDGGGDYTLDEVRSCEPAKIFFFRAREKVADGFGAGPPPPPPKPACITGVKACDLKSLEVQDYVFLTDEYTDPFYKRARDSNLIISADCTQALDTCFCMALGVNPFPEKDFDINLSKMEDGYVVETGSAKGERVVKDNEHLFSPADPSQVKTREETRKRVQSQVRININEYRIPQEGDWKGWKPIKFAYAFWNQDAKNCVECGACNTVCPTCHCFLLFDQGAGKKTSRMRVWDSCLIKDFARVAGGANPRPELWMRLRNRFEKKFDFFPKVLGINACTGCGRCIAACPAKIDIRSVLGRLAANAH